MNSQLKKYISKYVDLPEDELDSITRKFKRKKLKKNSYLLRQGDICNDLVYVTKGCMRLYYMHDDIEVSVWFAFPDSSAIEIQSFISGKPTNYFIQAIEDSEVLCLSKNELNKLNEIHPAINVLMRNFWEDAILTLLERFTALQTDPAEKRYLDLMNKPEYLQMIPQKYLASFIGITPTSLSRIRKNLSSNH